MRLWEVYEPNPGNICHKVVQQMIKTFESSNILKLKDCDTKNMDHDDDTRERVFATCQCLLHLFV